MDNFTTTPPRTLQSATLPRNFTYSAPHDNILQTPEQPTGGSSDGLQPAANPAQPPRVRIRRRRNLIPTNYQDQSPLPVLDDIPLPTIEIPQPPPDFASFVPDVRPATQQEGFLAPTPTHALPQSRFISPPKTPVSQLGNPFNDSHSRFAQNWSLASTASFKTSISRPSSAWSNLSDSSASSLSSSDSLPSFGDSCTSPESDSTDPFVFPVVGAKTDASYLQSPALAMRMPVQLRVHTSAAERPRKRQQSHNKVKWTDEMDEHLWLTYMTYLQDPTVTPFKMLPGTAPPLGVCHRVAREAKKTWKGPRTPLASIQEDRQTPILGASSQCATFNENAPAAVLTPKEGHFPDVLRPLLQRSISEDPPRKLYYKWPGSSSQTRKRFRELCKRKPTLAPHYQRLMQTRSPSPFESSRPRSRSHSSRITSPHPHSDAPSFFTTRDLNFSLATSTATSMQSDGPLAQLASEPQTPRPRESSAALPRPASRSGAHHAHQKSQSLQLQLGIPSAQQVAGLRPLASPFRELPPRLPSLPSSDAQPMQVDEIVSPSVPTLAPALELHHPRPMSGSMKRRAQYQLGEELVSDDPDTRLNILETLFSQPGASGKRRVRSRGFSLGAMSQTREHRPLADLFTPPSTNEELYAVPNLPSSIQQQQPQPPPPATDLPEPSNLHLFPPQSSLDRIHRLGSPFAPASASNGNLSNTFPRSFLPPGFLDGFASAQQPTQAQQMQTQPPPSFVLAPPQEPAKVVLQSQPQPLPSPFPSSNFIPQGSDDPFSEPHSSSSDTVRGA